MLKNQINSIIHSFLSCCQIYSIFKSWHLQGSFRRGIENGFLLEPFLRKTATQFSWLVLQRHPYTDLFYINNLKKCNFRLQVGAVTGMHLLHVQGDDIVEGALQLVA